MGPVCETAVHVVKVIATLTNIDVNVNGHNILRKLVQHAVASYSIKSMWLLVVFHCLHSDAELKAI